MKSASRKYKELPIQLIALALCIWLSGAVCVVSCIGAGAPTEFTKTSQLIAADKEFVCPMHGQPSDRGENGSDVNSVALDLTDKSSQVECCAFAGFLGQPAQKSKRTDVQLFAAVAKFSLSFPAASKSQKIPPQINYQALPRTRGDTYLRNCVFLI